MKQPTRITLVRHGETIWNHEMRMQGSQNIPLSEVGLEQARKLAMRLQHETYDHVYSSHLDRAHKTAETLAQTLKIPHRIEGQLRERSYGELEGLTRDEILERYPDFWGQQVQYDVSGLESFEDLHNRACNIINDIATKHAGENVLIVSHGGTINAFLHAISNGQYGTGVNKLGNTSLTHVIREHDGKWTIEKVGCTAHLGEE